MMNFIMNRNPNGPHRNSNLHTKAPAFLLICYRTAFHSTSSSLFFPLLPIILTSLEFVQKETGMLCLSWSLWLCVVFNSNWSSDSDEYLNEAIFFPFAFCKAKLFFQYVFVSLPFFSAFFSSISDRASFLSIFYGLFLKFFFFHLFHKGSTEWEKCNDK